MSRGNILLVDDDAGFLTALTKILTKNGYAVAAVCDVPSAVDAMKNRKQTFELVITDISMPMISGLTLLSAIRSTLPDVKVIVVTAVGDAGLRTKALADGAFAYFGKPLDREEFLHGVDRAMKSKKSRAD